MKNVNIQLTKGNLPERRIPMPDNILALLKNISDFIAKIIDAIKQVFDSFKPAESEDPSDASADV